MQKNFKENMKILILVIFFTNIYISLFSYETGKNPVKASLFSLLLPGGGQYYNESKIKSALFFSTETYFTAKLIYDHNKMNDYYDKALSTIGEEHQENAWNYDRYYAKRQNDLWWLGGIAFMSVIDAFIDAHLYNFDEEKRKIHLRFENKKVSVSYSF